MSTLAEVAAISAAAGALVAFLARPFLIDAVYGLTHRRVAADPPAMTRLIWSVLIAPPRPHPTRCPHYPVTGLQCARHTHGTGRHLIDPADLGALGYERRPF